MNIYNSRECLFFSVSEGVRMTFLDQPKVNWINSVLEYEERKRERKGKEKKKREEENEMREDGRILYLRCNMGISNPVDY